MSDGATCCATSTASKEATIEKDGKASPPAPPAGQVGSVLQAAGIALAPNLHERAA